MDSILSIIIEGNINFNKLFIYVCANKHSFLYILNMLSKPSPLYNTSSLQVILISFLVDFIKSSFLENRNPFYKIEYYKF